MSVHRKGGRARLVVVLAVACVLVLLAAPALATVRLETHAYYSVVKDEPFAPFTTADEFQRTSIHAYYSVVADAPYAPYTTADEFKRTSMLAYYSVVH